MNGSLAANEALMTALATGLEAQPFCEVAVCVPAPYLAQVLALRSADLRLACVALGAQDVSTHTAGAYTGEVSAPMLRDLGCRYAIVGHSERRQYHAESDEVVAECSEHSLPR